MKRIIPVVFLTLIFFYDSVHAQTSPPATDVHCEPDKSSQKQKSAGLEAKCLAQMKGAASRSGDKLRLVLQGGKTHKQQPCLRRGRRQ